MSLIRVKAFHYGRKEMKALDDNRIVDLYLSRDEAAISQTSEKYGSRLRNVAYGIVEDLHTAEECENDTYMLDFCKGRSRLKRSAFISELSAEMEQCIPAPDDMECRIDAMVLYNLLGGAIAFAEPSGLLHGHLFLTIHSCVWHMLLVFVGLFLCMSRRGGTEMSDFFSATWIFYILCGAAFALNCFVQFGLGQEMNMFFVGPGNSPIIVFKQFSEWFGWYINTPIYMLAVSLGAYLLFVLNYWSLNKNLPHMKKRHASKR